MPEKWEHFTGEGPTEPEQDNEQTPSSFKLDPWAAVVIVVVLLLAIAAMSGGNRSNDDRAYEWLPAESASAEPPAQAPIRYEPAPQPQPPRPIPPHQQKQVHGGKLTHELSYSCAGKPRGKPFQCGSVSPTGWCFCRD